MKQFSIPRSILVIGLVVLLALGMSAQTSRGAINGVVTDPTGASISTAQVTITQLETNTSREAATNAAGIYRFDAVNLGTYKITVTAPGFAPVATDGVIVRANQTSSMDFSLKLGSTNQTVTVEAEATAVALQSEEQLRGGNIEGSAIASLPVPGQNSLNLMTLLPGVVPTNLSGGGSLDSGIGSVNGSRPRANNFMIDGVENNDISVAGPALTLTNTDAIQEVSVQTANFSAEFGRSGGAVINQVTKTGTNRLHGTAAWVYRSDVLNAATFDTKINNQKKAPFIEQLPAYTIGGPVVIPHLYDGHNKTFFFINGQLDRYSTSAGLTRTVVVPTAAGIATLQSLQAQCPQAALYLKSIGSMVAPTKSNTISIAVDPAVFAITNSCTGTNRAGMGVDVGNAYRASSTVFKGNTEQVRLDHNFNEKHSINFRYMWSPGNYTGPVSLGMAPEFDAGYSASSYTGAVTDTYVINNHLTNELRLNYFRVGVDWPLLAKSGLGLTLPLVGIANMTTLGTSSSYPQGRTFNNYELQETMTAIAGRHTLRYGLDVNKQIARQIAPMAVRGSVNYANSGGSGGVPLTTGLANFLDDWSGSGSAVVSKNFGTAVYHPTAFRQSYFVQDGWKMKSNLTINVGLRYDFFGQSGNNNFKFPVVSLDPTVYPNPKKAYVDKNNWGPSIGFAYSPKFGMFSDGKTVIRGGYQIGFDGFYNNLYSNMATGAPNNPLNLPYNASISMLSGACANYAAVTCKGPRGVQSPYTTQFGTLVAAPFTNPAADSASQFTQNIANPYTMRYSLGVQREMFNNLILDLSYVGSQSRKLFYSVELNPRLADPITGLAGLRVNPLEGSRTVRDSGATSNYNGMQFEVRSRGKDYFFGRLLYSSSYTWSKTMDTISETFATAGQGSAYASSRAWVVQKPHGLLLDYGVSDLDRRHRWITSLQWDIRGPKKGVLGQIFGGWSVAGAIPLMSGMPYSMLNGYDRDGDGSSAADRPDIGNPNAPLHTRAVIASVWGSSAVTLCGANGLYNPETAACTTASAVHWVMTNGAPGAHTEKRNSVFTDGSVGLDMNFLKKFRIKEGVNFEARAEVFNLLNHYNFNYAPNGVSALGMRLDQSVANWLPLKSQSDYYTGPGSRTIRLGAKLIF